MLTKMQMIQFVICFSQTVYLGVWGDEDIYPFWLICLQVCAHTCVHVRVYRLDQSLFAFLADQDVHGQYSVKSHWGKLVGKVGRV